MPRKKKVTSAQADLAQAMKDMEALKSRLPELEKAVAQEKAEKERLAKEVPVLRSVFAETAAKLKAVDNLPEKLVEGFTGKDGLFNPWRTMNVKKQG